MSKIKAEILKEVLEPAGYEKLKTSSGGKPFISFDIKAALTIDVASQLSYISMCINESLRYDPPVH